MRIGRFDILCIVTVFSFFLHTVWKQQNKSLWEGLSGSINATKYVQTPCAAKMNDSAPFVYLFLEKR